MVAMCFGWCIGRMERAKKAWGQKGDGTIEAAVFTLLGLLIAFTFSGAAQRMVDRRTLIVQEVNAIDTAWRRIALLSDADQAGVRNMFRNYVDSRLDYYRNVADLVDRDAIAARSMAIQDDIWQSAVSNKTHADPGFVSLFVQGVNDMFKASTTITAAQNAHAPPAIYLFLGSLALLCALIVGLNLGHDGSRLRFHQVLYAVVMTATLYIIVDLEFPRLGYIRIDQIDALLETTRASMGALERLSS